MKWGNTHTTLLYYVKAQIKKDNPVYIRKAPSLQAEISKTLYQGSFLPVYEKQGGFLRTNEGWIQEPCIKDIQKVIPANITDIGIWIISQFLPRINQNRTCKYQFPQSIVCEMNSLYNKAICSQVEAADQLSTDEIAFSHHYTVSSNLIVQHIPDFEVAYVDPSQYPCVSIKNTIFIKICDEDVGQARAVVDSLCRLLQTWYGLLNIVTISH
ncbi:MAG: SH3 domain-containing protein [Anaerovoracaceae bacterium]